MRLIQKPGLSCTTIGVFPIRRPNATAVLTTPGAVRCDGITSSSGIRATGEKKCMPMTCSGRRAAAAIRWMGIVDVFEANAALSGVAASTSASTCCFTCRSSNTASITSSARPNPVYVSPPESSATSRACSYRVMRRRLSRSSRICRAGARGGAGQVGVLHPHAHSRLHDGRARDARAHEPRAHDAEPPHRDGRRRVRDPEVLLERGGGEEDLDELAGDVGDGELAEQLRLALQPFPDAVLQPVLHRFERGKGRGIVAAGLLTHLLARRPKHELSPQRVAVEQPGDEDAAPPALGAPDARHPLRGGEGDVLQDRRRHELVHDPEPEGPRGGLHLPGEDHVERGARADESRQPLAPAGPWEDAELHLREPKLGLRVIRGDTVAAGERELEPAAQAGAVNADRDRLGETGDALEQVLTVGREPLRLRRARERDEFLDVRACDERVGLPREKRDGLHLGVALERLECREDVLLDRARDLVDRFARQIERDDGDPVRELPGERRGGSHQRRSSTTAMAIPPWAQIDTRPNCTSRRTISFASVVTTRPPVAPNGWPIAIEPPMTLTMSSLISHPNARHPWRFESTCAAKASWTSISPRSAHAIPARSSALGTAKTGAWSSCQPGSTAATAYDRM